MVLSQAMTCLHDSLSSLTPDDRGLSAFGFDLLALPDPEREKIIQQVKQGEEFMPGAETRSLFERFGHSLYELAPDSEALGLDSGLDPLRWYRKRHAPHEWAAVENLAAQVPPLEAACRFSVCIPVAAAEEPSEGLQLTLQQYAEQSISPEHFEVVLFLNWPHRHSGSSANRRAELLEAISSVEEAHPRLRLRVLMASLPNEALRIGFIRKLVHDVVVQRQLTRGEEELPLVMLRGDADLVQLNPNFIARRLALHAKYPLVRLFRSEVGYPVLELEKDPALLFGTRLDQAVLCWLQTRWLGQVWGGWPTATFSTQRYATAEGYSRFDRIREDSSLDFRLVGHEPISLDAFRMMTLGTRDKMKMSARRLLAGVRAGIAPACAWVQEGPQRFAEINPEIRSGEGQGGGHQFFWNDLDSPALDSIMRKFVVDTVKRWRAISPQIMPEICSDVLPHLGIVATCKEPGTLEVQSIQGAKQYLRLYRELRGLSG